MPAHDDGATHSGAGVRKPPREETAGGRARWGREHDGSGLVGSCLSPVEKGGGSTCGSQPGKSVEWRAHALFTDWNAPHRLTGFESDPSIAHQAPPVLTTLLGLNCALTT